MYNRDNGAVVNTFSEGARYSWRVREELNRLRDGFPILNIAMRVSDKLKTLTQDRVNEIWARKAKKAVSPPTSKESNGDVDDDITIWSPASASDCNLFGSKSSSRIVEQPIVEQLRERVRASGLDLDDYTAGGGHCQYDALYRAMQRANVLPPNIHGYMDIQRTIADWLVDKEDHMMPDALFTFGDALAAGYDGLAWATFLNEIRKEDGMTIDGWGNSITLLAASAAFNICVHVYAFNGDHFISYTGAYDNIVSIGLHNELHYYGLLPYEPPPPPAAALPQQAEVNIEMPNTKPSSPPKKKRRANKGKLIEEAQLEAVLNASKLTRATLPADDINAQAINSQPPPMNNQAETTVRKRKRRKIAKKITSQAKDVFANLDSDAIEEAMDAAAKQVELLEQFITQHTIFDGGG